jgi:hypothetical protein
MVAESHSIQSACRVLDVSQSAFLRRPPSRPIAQVGAPRLVDRSDRAITHGITWHLRRSPGPRRSDARHGRQGRPRSDRATHGQSGIEGSARQQAAQARPSDPDLVRSRRAELRPDPRQTSCGSPTSPSTRPARARCTALSSSTRSAAESSAGRSTRHRARRSSRTRWAWPSRAASRRRERSSTPITAHRAKSTGRRNTS